MCALTLVCLAVATGNAEPATEIPSSAQVHTLLEEMIRLANRGEYRSLCRLHGEEEPLDDCLLATEALGPEALPISVDVRYERILETDGTSVPGRVLGLCVHLGTAAIRAEVYFIFWDTDAGLLVVAPHPDFWESRIFGSGGRLSELKTDPRDSDR